MVGQDDQVVGVDQRPLRGTSEKIIGIVDDIPVSYTHLDVYKRQQIEMIARRGQMLCPSEKLAGLNQREVESLPVKCDQPAKRGRESGKMVQHGLFFGGMS